MPALDIMWVSFYCIGFLIISVGLIYLARNKVSNGFLRTIVNLIAYILFGLGTFLMVLIVATWPA
ncbi:NAD(FAD)-dependent dehydrogenase [Lysinibacillus xylanilyticus]|uniref:NAD(FAD)-dependent dehydrogenase n=1 Tax=Lysinibacillus xylanilyticus TaxID=582475 RepID=A0A0K9FGB8_9BACI|nr:NAD(FAD)-dependent dehydrogenase [Lysinibacillus xylanilyticus]